MGTTAHCLSSFLYPYLSFYCGLLATTTLDLLLSSRLASPILEFMHILFNPIRCCFFFSRAMLRSFSLPPLLSLFLSTQLENSVGVFLPSSYSLVDSSPILLLSLPFFPPAAHPKEKRLARHLALRYRRFLSPFFLPPPENSTIRRTSPRHVPSYFPSSTP